MYGLGAAGWSRSWVPQKLCRMTHSCEVLFASPARPASPIFRTTTRTWHSIDTTQSSSNYKLPLDVESASGTETRPQRRDHCHDGYAVSSDASCLNTWNRVNTAHRTFSLVAPAHCFQYRKSKNCSQSTTECTSIVSFRW